MPPQVYFSWVLEQESQLTDTGLSENSYIHIPQDLMVDDHFPIEMAIYWLWPAAAAFRHCFLRQRPPSRQVARENRKLRQDLSALEDEGFWQEITVIVTTQNRVSDQ